MQQDIYLSRSVFLKLTKALILFKQKKLLQKHNAHLTYPILPSLKTVNHIYDQNGIKLSFDNLLCNNPFHWYQVLSNEFGRLTQSNDAGVRCTNAKNFIHHSQIPSNNKVTYASFVCYHRPLK